MNDNRAQHPNVEQLVKNSHRQMQKRLLTELVSVQNRVYSQLESLSWLQKALSLKWSLPPLRGWATSPDVLLRLHEHIRLTRPKLVVECGSGVSTVVIADALRQNGVGRLVALEHKAFFAAKTEEYLGREGLLGMVDMRVGALEPWAHPHLNESGELLLWYPESLVQDLTSIALLLVDGPPGSTCQYARYPAVPAMADKLASNAEVWMDDTGRQDERDICEAWGNEYQFEVEFTPLEKGLGRLFSAEAPSSTSLMMQQNTLAGRNVGHQPEQDQGLDFSVPEDFEG